MRTLMDVRIAPSACCLLSGAQSATTPTKKPPPLSQTALAPAESRAPRRSNPQQRVLPDRLASERRRGEHEVTTVVAGSLSAGGEPCAPMLPTAKPKPLPSQAQAPAGVAPCRHSTQQPRRSHACRRQRLMLPRRPNRERRPNRDGQSHSLARPRVPSPDWQKRHLAPAPSRCRRQLLGQPQAGVLSHRRRLRAAAGVEAEPV